MKFNYIKNIFAFAAIAAVAMPFSSCKDDSTDALIVQAYIEPDVFTVTSAATASRVFKAVLSEDGTKFSIQLPENLDPKEELVGAKANFYLSLGSTCTPPLSQPQDFTDPDNPVIYTVTAHDGGAVRQYVVDYVLVGPTKVDYGQPIPTADRCAAKGWNTLFGITAAKADPTYYDDWYRSDKVDLVIEKGDLMGMPAFCGEDNIVVFARALALGGKPDQAFKVFDPKTLAPKGTLNLGTIDPKDVVAVSSDWHSNMVAAVGRKSAGKSDIYIWTSPDATPKFIGSTHTSVEFIEDNADASSYLSVAGDVTGNAVIAFAGPRGGSDAGTHYKYYIYGGQLNSDYTEIQVNTGKQASDKNSFQMISFFGVKKSDPYMVGAPYKSEKTPDHMEDEVGVYIFGPDGGMRAFADYYNTSYNGWIYDHKDAGAWWQRTGQTIYREGGRRPTVHAMVLNGVRYAFWTTGSNTKVRSLISDTIFEEYFTNLGCFWGFGQTTLDLFNVFDIWQRDGYGCMADWYFSDETQSGYIALWVDRMGLVMFELSCVGFVD